MIVTQTPLRISFVGGGTDLPAYYEHHDDAGVISTAIDKYVYVILKRRFDQNIRVGYTRTELVSSVDAVQHELVRESMRTAGISSSIEVSTMADVPAEGSGLGSSSSVTVGLLNAMHTFVGAPQTLQLLGHQACEIEIGRLKHPIGKQDQYIAAFGGFREILFRRDGSVSVKRLAVPHAKIRALQQHMVVVFTGITRSANDLLARQTQNVQQTTGYLRELSNLRVEFRRAIEDEYSPIEELGRILDRAWLAKKKLATGISNTILDNIYAAAMREGAYGGKLLGAGGGGFFLFLAPPDTQPDLISKLGLKVLPTRFEWTGTKVLLNVQTEFI